MCPSSWTAHLRQIGGATGSIGDPSGRSTERTALEPDELARNVKGITDQVHRFFRNGEVYLQHQPTRDFGGEAISRGADSDLGGSVKVLNNYDWFKGVSFLDFLRDVGKLAKVNTMISRDRCGMPLSELRMREIVLTAVCARG